MRQKALCVPLPSSSGVMTLEPRFVRASPVVRLLFLPLLQTIFCPQPDPRGSHAPLLTVRGDIANKPVKQIRRILICCREYTLSLPVLPFGLLPLNKNVLKTENSLISLSAARVFQFPWLTKNQCGLETPEVCCWCLGCK